MAGGFWKRVFSKTRVRLLPVPVDIHKARQVEAAYLVHITGKGQLDTRRSDVPGEPDGQITYFVLNGIPLVQMHQRWLPSRASLLATGDGIEKANCSGLKTISSAMNQPFSSLEDSIRDMRPLLGLLQSGLYVIADMTCYPTDGQGAFFWYASNGPCFHEAADRKRVPGDDCCLVEGQAAYLYPTQNADCLDEQRVQFYVHQFSTNQERPRAIVYCFSEFLSFILDGHHKACAAALLGQPLCCIGIFPFTGYHVWGEGKQMHKCLHFSAMQVQEQALAKGYRHLSSLRRNVSPALAMSAGTVNNRAWEKAYTDAAGKYPTLEEYASLVGAGLSYEEVITPSQIEACFAEGKIKHHNILRGILFLLEKRGDARWKELALRCARLQPDPLLKEQIFSLFLVHKGDADIEAFLIQYLADVQDKKDPYVPLAIGYWE